MKLCFAIVALIIMNQQGGPSPHRPLTKHYSSAIVPTRHQSQAKPNVKALSRPPPPPRDYNEACSSTGGCKGVSTSVTLKRAKRSNFIMWLGKKSREKLQPLSSLYYAVLSDNIRKPVETRRNHKKPEIRNPVLKKKKKHQPLARPCFIGRFQPSKKGSNSGI